MCQAQAQFANNQIVTTKPRRHTDMTDATSQTFPWEKSTHRYARYGQSGPSWGDGCNL